MEMVGEAVVVEAFPVPKQTDLVNDSQNVRKGHENRSGL